MRRIVRARIKDPKADSMDLHICPSCGAKNEDPICVEPDTMEGVPNEYIACCSECLEYLYHFANGNYVNILFNEQLKTYFIRINGKLKYKALLLESKRKTIDNLDRAFVTDLNDKFIETIFVSDLKYLK